MVAFQRPGTQTHLTQAQGFTGMNCPTARHILVGRGTRSKPVWKKQDLHSLLSQPSRMTAPTRGTTDKNEKSTMLEEYGLINTDFFPLFLPIPISPESCLHFFSQKQSKKEPAAASLGGITYTHSKAQNHQEGLSLGAPQMGHQCVFCSGQRAGRTAAFHPAGLKLSPM